jgi:hypothetical protein
MRRLLPLGFLFLLIGALAETLFQPKPADLGKPTSGERKGPIEDTRLQRELDEYNRALLMQRCAKNPEAISNGDKLLHILAFTPADAAQRLKPLVGQKVAFYGGSQGDGSTANLLIAKDVVLDVEIIPPLDPRPV